MMKMQSVALFFLASVAMGGVAWVFIYPMLTGEKKMLKRRESVASAAPAAARAVRGQKSRREQVEDSLKELETRQKKTRAALHTRIAQAGLTWSKNKFLLIAAGIGIAVFLAVLGTGFGLLPAIGFCFAAAAGLPFWFLSFLKARREKRFLELFPDAVDVIVRGIKSGLPLNDNLRAIANEAREPLGSEFRAVMETQSIGIPLADACGKMYERMPLAEVNFFAIVIGIQQRAGGNLAEALGNLSRVLRDRKRMKAKISAMSMEAKASAGIIASLPVAVMILIYLSSPSYIELLWTTSLGRMMLMGCVVWMSMGVMVMKKMINFDF